MARMSQPLPTPEIVADVPCVTGEGPLWHPDERLLYWTDIPSGILYRYNPANHRHEKAYDDRPVGGYTLQADGSLLLFRDRGNVVVWRDGAVIDTIIDEIPDEAPTRFNDVFADPAGRVYCGTMPTRDRLGRLYRLDTDGSIHRLLDGIGCSNGMGLTRDGTGLYYIDTPTHHVYRFDYDRDTGSLTNQTVFITTPEGDDTGMPDGMTVDAEGNLWVAMWEGESVLHYGSDGQLIDKLPIPGAVNVTCPTFAGDGYDTMYITTAMGQNRPDTGEHAGALYAFKPGVKGVPECRSRVGL